MPANESQREVEAVGWFARLPFLGADELSLLLRITRPQATKLLWKMRRLGWVEHVETSSPELEPDRLYALTEGCLPTMAQRLELSGGELEMSFPVGRRETLERLVRLETAVGLNRFAAELVVGARDDVEVELDDVRSLPWRRRPAQAWWPPEAEGFGCLRWGPWHAPFFVAWDRAGAPPFHRRRRVAAWYTFRDTHHPWGRDDIPPILVVCPGEAEAEQWARAVLAARREVGLLPVFLTDVTSALREGPLGPVWRRPDGSVRAHLCERLVWRPAIPEEAKALRAENQAAELEPIESGQPLWEWAKQVAALPEQGRRAPGTLERLAALSVVASPIEKRTLEWLGHHPLLSADDLAVVLRVSRELPQRLLDNLSRYGLVDSTDRRLEEEVCRPHRYFLTHVALKLLAARDGVPPRRCARHGIVAAAMPGKQGGGRLQTLLRQLDHTVGVNRFFVSLIAAGAKGAPRLVRWLSASEAAQRFTCGDVPHWLRPDGVADVHWQGKVRRFYLEWDRGTMRRPETVEKSRAYAAFFANVQPDVCPGATLPYLLVVTSAPSREKAIWDVLRAAFGDIRLPAAWVFTTLDTLVERLGVLGPIWRSGEGAARVSWPVGK